MINNVKNNFKKMNDDCTKQNGIMMDTMESMWQPPDGIKNSLRQSHAAMMGSVLNARSGELQIALEPKIRNENKTFLRFPANRC